MTQTPVDTRDTLEVHVWRGREDGRFEVHEVPASENQTILDVVTWLQRHKVPALAYRFACRVGVCGSCAMTVNGRPRWTCRSHVKNVVQNRRLVIEPLRNLPRIKDLACDLTPFFDKWVKAGGHFEGTAMRDEAFAQVQPDSPERSAANAGIECINCAVCYSACDVVSWRKEYLGPAALNRAWTLFNDVRHARRHEILDTASENGGCVHCHSHGSCTEYCPVGISPTAAIGGLKRAAFRRWMRGEQR